MEGENDTDRNEVENMCVALPGKVIEIKDRDAVVDFNGNQIKARAGLADIKTGDYVLVHAGCIIQKVSRQDADDLVQLMEETGGFA